MPKLSNKDRLEEYVRMPTESGLEVVSRDLSTANAAPASQFVILGKYVAPRIGWADTVSSDSALVGLAREGHDPDHIAGVVGARVAEVTVRLVELRTGPLGCIRPAADAPVSCLFYDVKLRRAHRHVPVKQKPVLSLVAQAFGHRLQRLGDRLYLSGQETTLSALVHQAREKGVRIRYPLLDPMEDAWNTGPTRRDPQAVGASRSGQSALPGWLQ